MQRFQSAIAFVCSIGAVAVACGGSSSGGGSSGTAESSTGTTAGGNPDASSGTTDASTGIGAGSGTTASSGVPTASSGTTSVGGNCSLGAGTYTIHYVATSGGALCPPIQDVMTTLTQTETPADAMNPGLDAGTCTTTASGCMVKINCNEGEMGISIQVSVDVTVGNNSATGTFTEVFGQDGSTLANCSYNITYTKN
jgi:hypothetical protein